MAVLKIFPLGKLQAKTAPKAMCSGRPGYRRLAAKSA